jgi:hypothetical protein
MRENLVIDCAFRGYPKDILSKTAGDMFATCQQEQRAGIALEHVAERGSTLFTLGDDTKKDIS